MLLDLLKPFEAKKAQTKLSQLIEKGAKIELTEKKAMRSVKQNSYLHAILTIFAVEYGETIEYTKQTIFKATVNAELFIYERTNKKTGEIREDLKSTKEKEPKEGIYNIHLPSMKLNIEFIKKIRSFASKISNVTFIAKDGRC